MPTLYDIAKRYKHTGESGKVTPTSESLVKGLTPSKEALKPGYRILKPEQLAALHVPQLSLNGKLDGYQRGDRIRHARKIARAISRGEEMPPLSVSLVDGKAELTDGQHRGLGAIIARASLPAVIKARTETASQRFFANQRQALPVSADTIVLAADGLFAEYVQEAVTAEDHAWSEIVGAVMAPVVNDVPVIDTLLPAVMVPVERSVPVIETLVLAAMLPTSTSWPWRVMFRPERLPAATAPPGAMPALSSSRSM